MADAMFEKMNKPIGGYPFISINSINLNDIPHYHESMEIICVKSGTILVGCGLQTLELKKDDICIFMPGEIHSFRSTRDNRLYVMKLDVNAYIENIDFEKLRLESNCLRSDDAAYLHIRELIEEITDEYVKKEQGYEFAIKACKNKIIAAILRNLPFSFVDCGQNKQLLTKINKFLEENYDQRIELKKMAEVCHLSKYYFAHKLKEMTGMTFVEYLTAFRLEKAVNFLKADELSITDISYRSGFGSLRSFNRAFMARYGMTPSAFRKEKNNG